MPDFARIFAQTRSIAVLGAHADSWRPAFYVPDYLARVGYRILPVNVALVGKTLWEEPVRATLAELPAVEMVDVFRRAEALPAHLEDLLAMRPLPKVVWLQSGIWNPDFAKALEAAGVEVVQDRCTMVERQRLG